jgi:hypothetical protein
MIFKGEQLRRDARPIGSGGRSTVPPFGRVRPMSTHSPDHDAGEEVADDDQYAEITVCHD